MIVVMREGASAGQIEHVVERLVEDGFKVHRTTGNTQIILAGVGRPDSFDVKEYEVLDGVTEAYRISSPYKLAGRNFAPEGTVMRFPNGERGRKPRAAVCCRGEREAGGRAVPPRRGVQAPVLALLVPGHGPGRAQAAAGSRGHDGSADHYRGHGDRAD